MRHETLTTTHRLRTSRPHEVSEPQTSIAEVRNVVTGQGSIKDTHVAVLVAVGMFVVVIFRMVANGALAIAASVE